MDINKMKSELKMENFFFSECTVVRAENIKREPYGINLEKEIKELDPHTFTVKLTLLISKPEKDLDVKVVANATFMIENTDTNLVQKIISTNTVAIMFPFIRSQVSLLTTQPGLTPIILPPINTSKFT